VLYGARVLKLQAMLMNWPSVLTLAGRCWVFLLLAGITSLPEIATSFTAPRHNNASLAVSNLLGSIAMQIAVLAAADTFYWQMGFAVVPNLVVILQVALNICLLAFVAMAIIVGVNSAAVLVVIPAAWFCFIP
jgi:Ca2+/Na+ antiporter